ncbi:CoA transferase family III [Microterricola gilva]|uniref:CoA transferase family III n=1 Tax=Microterricola gilva TaxID=393267 RepID=A0A4Q8AQ37_9MICO|nr:CoA transferase [Microterricola gilva]RZU66820.1 CoA transferase family III [Microterricola gilva]
MGSVLERLEAAVGADRDRVGIEPGQTGLTARLRAGELATDSVAFVAGQAARLLGLPDVSVSPRRVGVNFSSYNYLSIDGEPAAAWAPLSGFFPTSDGWVRTHANYPHHALRLRLAFELPDTAGRKEFAAALAGMSAAEAEARAVAADALCVRVRRPEEFAGLIAPAPLLEWDRSGGWSSREADRVPRVLDLSRVIAGPTCTRALALLGADVLRVDPVEPAEIAMQHIDTGAGKRSITLDLGEERGTLEALLAGADVVVLGYRPGSLDRFGLDEQSLRARHPHLVVAALSAYPQGSAWAERRGFDSLVQAASGIAVVEGSAEKPGVLRAQALDHATGYMLAGGICAALAEGSAATMRASLAATAQALIGLGVSEQAEEPLPGAEHSDALAAELETVPSAYGELRRARAIIELPGRSQGPVVPLGSSTPAWL